MRRVERALILVGLCALVAACSSKGYNTDNPDWAQGGMPLPPKVTSADAEWKESEAPPPPKFDVKRLEPIAMPPYMTLKFGVDPGTITITDDGIARYVVVASSTHNTGGALTAYYEAVRCSTAEMKSYARFTDGAWTETQKPEWKSFRDLNSSYARQLAIQGLCRGDAPRASVKDIVQNLRDPARKLQ